MDSNHVLARLDVSPSARRRAETQPFAFELVTDGVRVTNHSYEQPSEHSYVVTVDDGLPISCECPADTHYDSACKHRLAVAIRTPVLQAAVSRCTTAARAVADGGTQPVEASEATPNADVDLDNDHDGSEDDPEWCDCAGLEDGFPCFECVRRGRRHLPDA